MQRTINKVCFLALMVVISGGVQAAKIIDTMQPNISPGNTWAIGGDSEQKLAQTITIQHAGLLKGIYLPLACDDGRLKLSVTDVVVGEPGTTVLTQNQFRANRINQPVSTFRFFRLPGNLNVTPGDELAIVLENQTGTCGLSQSPVGDSYPGGVGYFDARPNPPGWVALFGPGSALDLPFMLKLKTP